VARRSSLTYISSCVTFIFLCVDDRDQQGLGFGVVCKFARDGFIVVLAARDLQKGLVCHCRVVVGECGVGDVYAFVRWYRV
jgi:hypothetical protein